MGPFGWLVVTCLFIWMLWTVFSKVKDNGCPPVQSGWIPWLGCAVEFGKSPLTYIQQTKQKLGDIFTLHVAGKRMTFLTGPEHYQHYFTTTDINFQQAVEPFTRAAAGLSPQSFFKHHSAIHDTIKGRLIPSYVTDMCPLLSGAFHTSFGCHGKTGERELMDFVRDPMFEAVVRQLFGEENVPASRDEMREMMNKFVKYDADFEYGAELPELFLKDWSKSKHWLLSLFKQMVDGVMEKGSGDKPTLLDQLMTKVDSPSAHSYALLLLWASQANAVPAVYWTLVYILSHPQVHTAVRKEISAITTFDSNGEYVAMTESSLKSLPLVKRCVLEAVRLRSPGMILRKVIKTHHINGYTIPAGHLLIVSPYWSHRNEGKFPKPETFNPDRWLDCDLGKAQLLDGFVGFGGGRYQCPGRWFALMEMHLFVAMTLQLFDLELLDPVPEPSTLRLVGVQQPTKTCRVRYSRR